MSDYVTRLFREALGRLEGEYRGEGLDAMALAARSLAADESKSYAAAHAVLDEGARLGERFDPFTYPALAMAATDDAIRRGGITVGSDSVSYTHLPRQPVHRQRARQNRQNQGSDRPARHDADQARP